MRKLYALVLSLVLLTLLPLSASAAFYDGGVTQYVVDQAQLLSDQELLALENTACSLSEQSGCEVLIALVDGMDGTAAGDYAAELNSGRFWDCDDAVLFLLAMEEREWYIATFGDGIYTFTDYGIDLLGEAVVPYLSEGRYYDGFSLYLQMLPEYFSARQGDAPMDDAFYDPGYRQEVVHYPKEEKSFLGVLPLSAVIGLVAAAVAVLVMRSAMNTRRRQRTASSYLKPGSYHLHTHQDLFLYSNLRKTPRQQNTGSSGGGSSIHRSSGGRSHGGRGGKF